MQKIISIFCFIIILAVPSVASAHQIGGNGLASGLTHPIFGFDHLLAMVAVGIISVQMGKRGIWKMPAVFVSFMLVGALLSINGLHLPFVETGIAVSVLLLGIIIALSGKLPLGWSMGLIALFAVFHGHAHGEELPVIANATLYAIGFVTATVALHVSGVMIGYYAKKTQITTNILRYSGAAMGLAGIFFLLGL